MKYNVGKKDRMVRFVFGVILFVWGVVSSSWLLGIVGVILIATGFMRVCMLYKLVGMNTCPLEKIKK